MSYQGLEKYFPKYTNEQIKNELNLFKQVYNEVVLKVCGQVNNIIGNKDQNKEIIEGLREYFPGYNKKFILTLKENVENITNEQILKDIIDNVCEEKTTCALLDPDYMLDSNIANEFIKTAKSIGVLDKNLENSYYLSNRNEKPERNPSAYNYEENYKKRLGGKLLLCTGEINALSLDALENMTTPFIELAISHMKKVLDSISASNKIDLESAYFKEIHSQEKNVSFFRLFKLYYKLEKERKKIHKENDLDIYENHLQQIKIGQYEIQRIFALTVLYIRREHNLTYQNAKEEQDFLIKKLSELGSKKFKGRYINSEIISDNILYNYTKQIDLYCGVKSNGKYKCDTEYEKGFTKVQFDTFELEGKYRNYDKDTHSIKLLHVGSRVRKNPFSSVEKLLRKRLSSFNEILDHKGFIFVIETYDDYEILKKILEYEFGSLTTSWIEENKSMKDEGNKNTDREYECKKGVLKVNYKGKLIKDFFELLGNFLEHKNFMEIYREVSFLSKKENQIDSFKKLSRIMKKIRDDNLQKYYYDLKEKIGEQRYFIEVEIQIFDKQNYLKAEIDENSPAYHGQYKGVQGLETLPLYFPDKIYGNATKKILQEELPKTQKYSHLI